MNQEEFLNAVLSPMRKIAAAREVERARVDLENLSTAPVTPEQPIAIGCFGPDYQLVFGTNDDFDISSDLRKDFEILTEATLSSVVAEAAKEFCRTNRRGLERGTEVNGPDVCIVVETLFYLYVRSKGEYSPRPGRNLRIANLQFTDIHSNSRTMFLAYWTKRRLQ
jgi:hypothetical protein